jgi:flagellar hook-length control protein FliK
MSIEVSSAPKGVKAAASADPHGKKAGKAGTAGEGGGFSALMNLLSAAEDGATGMAADTSLADTTLADKPLTDKDGLSVDATAAGVGAALLLQPFAATATATATATPIFGAAIAELPVSTAVTQPMGGAMPLPTADVVGVLGKGTKVDKDAKVDKDVKDLLLPSAESIGSPGKAGQQAKVADTGALLKSAPTSAAGDVPSVGTASAQAAADLTQASPVSALLAHKSAVQAQTLSITAQDLKEVRAAASLQAVAPAADATAALLVGAQSELARPQGRFGARSGSGQSGSSGFESAFGQAMAATNRSEAAFEVPPASAVVPDTAVAETVSYWASHGVQTAELTLDGFGDAPVKVSILLNGDQAQIDFRTDQAGVRQVLENAAAQLKDMLSSQGLQLAGVSVGSSGTGGDASGDRRQRPGAQQITLVKTEAVGASVVLAANPSVGRSLDLFV